MTIVKQVNIRQIFQRAVNRSVTDKDIRDRRTTPPVIGIKLKKSTPDK